jgi:branched-chain amino acid transport system permease protein
VVLLWSGVLPAGPAIVGALVVLALAALGGLIGVYSERKLPRRVAAQSEITSLILTFALFLMFEDIMKLIFGLDPLLPSLPSEMLGAISLAGITYERYKVLQLGVAIVSGFILWFVVNRTLFGKLIVSVIADREVSAAMGINVPRVFTGAFIIGAIMAAVGGAFIAPTISVVPGIAVEVIILAFAVTTIGGLGSVPGAAIGALLAGVLRSAAVHTVPELDLFVVYALMTLILLIKPQGLFGGVQARRI